MLHLVVLCSGLLAASDPPTTTTLPPTERSEYEAAKARAGRDPAAHVKLALWCEAHGLEAERLRHLAIAVATDPKNVTARGLMGLVALGDRWLRPQQAADQVKADATVAERLAEYNARRARIDQLAEFEQQGVQKLRDKGDWIGARRLQLRVDRKLLPEHTALGVWCEEHGLKPEAVAHFTAAVQIDPYRDATWKHLGYVKAQGRWMTHEQIAAEEREALAQRKAARHWEPLFRKWRTWLGDDRKKSQAEALLTKVDDRLAVASVVRVFGGGNAADQLLAVRLLGQIGDPAATRELASMAILSTVPDVRQRASEMLRGRERRDYVERLVRQIHSPIHYQFQPVTGPGSRGALAVDTPRFRMLRTYDAPPLFKLASSFHGYVGYDGNGLPFVAEGREMSHLSREKDPAADIRGIEARTVELIAQANLKAIDSQQRLVADVTAIETFNAQSALLFQRIAPVLRDAAGAPDLPADEDAWLGWWNDQLGYRYEPPPKMTLAVNASPQTPAPLLTTCFAAGTPVRTFDGLRPIEVLRVGDEVLSQDVTTGALAFQPVVGVHHNAPGGTLRIALENGDMLVASVYHRFWRAGKGWAMARELKPGDILRTLEGLSRVGSIEPGERQPLYNLDVAQSRTFFAGKSGALVHDNTLPDPRLQPFDAP